MAYSGGRWPLGLGVASLLVLSTGVALAEDQREEVTSITFSPLHLIAPVIELQGEYKVIDHLGVSLIGGYGWPESDGIDFQLFEAGTQVMGYPLRKFRSLQLGAELVYIHVWADGVGDTDASGFAGGVAVGPLVGFKFIAGPGFTGFVQGGVSFVVAHAEASDNTGASDTEDDSAVLPNLNLNVGWSF